jgi:hypothetical protein
MLPKTRPSTLLQLLTFGAFGGLMDPGPLPRGNHRHCKGPIKKASPAKRRARKQRNMSRRKNR